MGMEISNNYSSYVSQSMTESSVTGKTRKKETEKTSKTSESSKAEGMSKTSENGKTEGLSKMTGSSKTENRTDYMRTLEKLAPSVEFRTGFAPAGDKSGKTLTINPKLLEKMQNDPAMEKEMKELIAGVEKMTKIADAFEKARGMTCVFRHSYIDENGKYCQYSYVVREDKLNEKLREERRQNSEKLIKKTRENVAEKKEELQEQLEEKKTEKLEQTKKEESEGKAEEKTLTKAESFLDEKIANFEDGMIYIDDAEFKTILEAIKEEDAGKIEKKEQTAVGANLDLKV